MDDIENMIIPEDLKQTFKQKKNPRRILKLSVIHLKNRYFIGLQVQKNWKLGSEKRIKKTIELAVIIKNRFNFF